MTIASGFFTLTVPLPSSDLIPSLLAWSLCFISTWCPFWLNEHGRRLQRTQERTEEATLSFPCCCCCCCSDSFITTGRNLLMKKPVQQRLEFLLSERVFDWFYTRKLKKGEIIWLRHRRGCSATARPRLQPGKLLNRLPQTWGNYFFFNGMNGSHAPTPPPTPRSNLRNHFSTTLPTSALTHTVKWDITQSKSGLCSLFKENTAGGLKPVIVFGLLPFEELHAFHQVSVILHH